jgi:hypothetical protein
MKIYLWNVLEGSKSFHLSVEKLTNHIHQNTPDALSQETRNFNLCVHVIHHIIGVCTCASLFVDFESLYSRRMFTRVKDCWNRPISSSPSNWFTVMDVVSDDYNQTQT